MYGLQQIVIAIKILYKVCASLSQELTVELEKLFLHLIAQLLREAGAIYNLATILRS